MTWSHEDTQGFQMLCFILIIYALRKIPPFDVIWAVLKITFFIILIMTTAGLALRWLKNLFR